MTLKLIPSAKKPKPLSRVGISIDAVIEDWGLLEPLVGAVRELLELGSKGADEDWVSLLKSLWRRVLAARTYEGPLSSRIVRKGKVELLAEGEVLVERVAKAFRLLPEHHALLVELKFAAFSATPGGASAHLEHALRMLTDMIEALEGKK